MSANMHVCIITRAYVSQHVCKRANNIHRNSAGGHAHGCFEHHLRRVDNIPEATIQEGPAWRGYFRGNAGLKNGGRGIQEGRRRTFPRRDGGIYVLMYVCVCIYAYMYIYVYVYTCIWCDVWCLATAHQKRNEMQTSVMWTEVYGLCLLACELFACVKDVRVRSAWTQDVEEAGRQQQCVFVWEREKERVCTYMCMCVYICICMYVCMYVGMYVSTYTHIYTHVWIYIYTHVCMYVCSKKPMITVWPSCYIFISFDTCLHHWPTSRKSSGSSMDGIVNRFPYVRGKTYTFIWAYWLSGYDYMLVHACTGRVVQCDVRWHVKKNRLYCEMY